MLENSSSLRAEFAASLLYCVPMEQISTILSAFDEVLSGYRVEKTGTDLITQSGSAHEFVKMYIASKAISNLSVGTIYQYKLRLEDFTNTVSKPITEITTNDIRLYLYHYKSDRNATNNYLDQIRKILSGFFCWLQNNNYIDSNPCTNVEHIKFQPAERKPLTSYELEILRYNCHDIREKAVVDFLFSTGCRVSEFCAANKHDIDWQQRSLVIRHGKGDKRRVVFFNAESELTLRKYLETRCDDSEALFVGSRSPHNRLSVKAVQNILNKVSARCNMHVYPHMLRHTFATSGIRSGMPLEKLQTLMGHAEPRTTLIYAKMDQSDLRREHMRVYS